MRSPRSRISIPLNTTLLKKLLCIFLPVLMLTAVSAGGKGSEFWEKKAFDEWSQKECQQLLQDSPWAKKHQPTSAQVIGSFAGAAGVAVGADATDSQPPYVAYQVQLRSAQPIRQALVRQMRIAQNYDKLPVEQKQQFDKSAQSFLLADTSEMVIVYVSYSTNFPENYRDLNRHWMTQTTGLLKNSVFLRGSKGDKVPIAQYIPGQEGQNDFQFIFPRKVNGKEMLSPEDKALQLEFAYPIVGKIGDGQGFVEFKVDKMKVNDEVAY